MGVFRRDQSAAQAVVYSAPRPLTAAAAQVKIKDKAEAELFKARRSSSVSQWQQEAWEYYDAIGEIKYAFGLVGSITSRVKLYAAVVDDPSESPVNVQSSDKIDPQLADAAKRALARLDSSYGGQAGLLRDAALNILVAGEALALDTVVPTPNGLTTMGELRDGDFVFGGDGTPARVVKALPVQKDRPVYEVTFGSGATIIADENHLWEVYTAANRRWAYVSGKQLEPKILTTKEMIDSVKYHGVPNYAIKRAATAQTHHDLLPIDPYILGYWLGDGWSSQGALTAHPDDQESLKSELSRAGYESKTRNAGGGYQVAAYGLQVELRGVGVLNNKHVPEEYFLASEEARLALIQGLVDSDGHVYRNGSIEFSNKNPEILRAFVRLTASLGLKPGQIKFRADGTGRVHVRSAGLPLARLPRKAAKLGRQTERDRWDYIRSITPAGTRDVRCISVDSPGNTFLVTENHIRTHNCYLVQQPARPGSGLPESWDIRSVDELRVDGRNQYILQPRREAAAATATTIPADAFVGRIWRAHPRYSDEPDSSMKGILDLCAELLLLNRTFRATARSRLNAGAMYLPDGLSVAAQPESGAQFEDEVDITQPTEDEEADLFEMQLIDAMTTPISDESSASAVVPLIIRGPAELGEKIKIMKFERSFDPALADRSDRVLERILQGLDVPKDTVTGLANVKYSNAVQIDESLYKAHIEPMLLLLSDALTVVYLRPYLRSLGYPETDVDRIVVWYDPSAVSTRNDRAADADSGFEKGAISLDTWRRMHGFSDADAPSPTETALRMMLDKGSITPELTEAMLAAFAPEAMDVVKQAAQGANPAPVPPEVQQMLQGAPAAPAAPPAPEGEAAPAAPAAPAEAAPAGGEEPPVPLAEPTP